METGGSILRAAKAANLPPATLHRLMATPWWRERIKESGWSPVTARELGRTISVEVGHRALEILTEPEALWIKDLVELGRLGRDLQEAEGGGVIPGRISILTQVDLRGLPREELLALRGGDDDDDVIDAEWSDVE